MPTFAILTCVIELSWLFVLWPTGGNGRRAGYLPVLKLYKEQAHRLEYISFIIHVDFNHAWAEDYPITLNII